MKKTLLLVAWIIALQFIGYSMGMLTKANLVPWYQALPKSLLTPPGYVFGLAWGILYILLATAGWYLFHAINKQKLTQLRYLFSAQLLLNWAWTPIFFYLHWLGLALLCLIAIVALTTYFLILAWRQSQFLFCLLLPYWLWICFAMYLNGVIWGMTL